MGKFYGNQHTDSTLKDYDYENLVEDVAELAEELGRPPTTNDANQADSLPSIASLYRVIKDDWVATLRDAGVHPTKNQRRSVPIDRRERMLKDLRQTNRETEGNGLRLRQYDEHGAFHSSALKGRFGTWSEACKAAGIECGSRRGVQCTCSRGDRLDSLHERLVAVFLAARSIEYVVHPEVGDPGYISDFYLPNVELWVEVDGYVAFRRPNAENMEAKREYFNANTLDYVVVEDGHELAGELRDRDILPR